MPVHYQTTGPTRPLVHQIDDSPFLPPGNGWNRRGEPVAELEKVPAPERMFDGEGRLAYAAGALVPETELAGLIPESRLYQTAEPVVAVEEPEPVSAKPTKAKTRAKKQGENRSY